MAGLCDPLPPSILLLLLSGICLTARDLPPFDMNDSIRSMGDSIYIKNEHVCEGDVYIGVSYNFKLLDRCTLIDGDLIIATLNKCCINATFPRLKEITGKFIVYYTTLESLGMFPNLVVIRGRDPLRGYSLILVDNVLRNLHFPSLRVIQEGGVRISKNHELCYVETILWTEMIGDFQVDLAGYKKFNYRRNERAMILLQRNRGICADLCNESLHCPQRLVEAQKKELCWSANVCQSLCDRTCDGRGLACWMNATSKCCHEECLGGCYGDGPELCVACKHFVFDSQCVRKCPQGFFEYLNRTCITKKKCFEKEAKDATGYRQNVSYSIYDGRCVKTCPFMHRRNASTGVCEQCNDNCRKACGDAFVYNVKTTDKFMGCTSLQRLHISIREDVDSMDILKRNFRQLRAVEQSVIIINSGWLNSLAFLANLRSIGELSGNRSEGNHVFEVVANDGLEDLWTPKHDGKVSVFGRVRIYLNRKLCANKIFDFLDNHLELMDGNFSSEERTFTQKVNGDLMPCNVATINLTVMQTSSRTAYVKWSQPFMGERSPFVTYLMIKPSETNISLSEDRPGCASSRSWAHHELQSCPMPPAESDGSPRKYCIHTVYKLLPATRYAVFVERKTTQGDHGAISPVVYFFTQSEPPSPPRDIRVTALSSSSLKVSWRPPRNPNGRVARYFVWYRPLKLNKREFARRSFCTYKSLMVGSRRERHKDATTLSQRNVTGYTCEECHKRCPRAEKFFSVVDDVNFSFEDSLQNHIFVKRPKLRGRRPYVATNGSRAIDNYEPYVTTGDMRKSSGAEPEPDGQNVTRSSDLKASTPETPVMKEPQAQVPTLRPTVSPQAPLVPKDDGKSAKMEWEGMASVDANRSEIIITNLRHYTEYIVAIRACQEPRSDSSEDVSSSSKNEGGISGQIPDESDQIPMPGYDSNVCSKKASRGYRTLSDDRADSLVPGDIEVNRENGLRVLWSRPADPNGMILVYWFHYRRVDEPGKKSDPDFWIQSCVPLQAWYQTYYTLQQHRLDAQGARKRQKLATSPPVLQYESGNASGPEQAPVAPSFNSDDQLDISFLEAERGGYEFPQEALSAGEYEFTIMAYSLAGNGSETTVLRFRIGQKQNSPDNLLLAIGAALLVLVVLLPLFLFLFCRRRRDGPEVMFPNPEYPGLTPTDEWEIPQDDIVYYNECALGRGYFGVVVKGVVRNLSTPAVVSHTDSVQAAIKTVHKRATYQEKLEFLSEANRMKAFNSEHIVKLLGVVSRLDSRDAMPQVVLEFMCHGDMASYLKQISDEEAIDELSERKIMLWAAQIADGMAYLGQNRVVHRDLAARNCLVDANEVVKISDFGLTRELYYQEYAYKKKKSRGGVIGPFMWMAPEALARGHFSYQSDVWSYGVVLWEIATLGMRPYPAMDLQDVKNFVLAGSNLVQCHDLWDNSWKRRCPDSVMDLMRRCFAFNDKDRPTFMAILQSLETYMDDRFIQKSFYCQQQYTC